MWIIKPADIMFISIANNYNEQKNIAKKIKKLMLILIYLTLYYNIAI